MWLRIAYDLGMMHGTIQDICVKPYSFLPCMYQSKVDKHVLSLIFVLYFYSHIYLSAIHFTFYYLFLHIFFLRFRKTSTLANKTTNTWWVSFLFNE